MSIDAYRVEFTKYSQSHYLKKFETKYLTRWLITRKAIVTQLGRVMALVESSRADIIKITPAHILVKLDFAIAGVPKSPKASGNRLIAYVNRNNQTVEVLLIYSKNEISNPNETHKWQMIIRQQYPDIWQLFTD